MSNYDCPDYPYKLNIKALFSQSRGLPFYDLWEKIRDEVCLFVSREDDITFLTNYRGMVISEEVFETIVDQVRRSYRLFGKEGVELTNRITYLRFAVAWDMTEAKKVSGNAGYVYIIQAETGEYKIGRTKNINQRMQFFGVKLPFEFELVHLIPTYDMVFMENELHSIYDYKRINGEWFDLNDEDIDFLKKHLPTSFSRMEDRHKL